MPKGPITWTDDDCMAEIERLRGINEAAYQTCNELRETNVRLRAALEDVDRWLAAFIEAWDKTAPHKATEAPVALMEAIRQHSAVREALQEGE